MMKRVSPRVVGVDLQGYNQLPQIAFALCRVAGFFCFGQRRQQQSGQNGNDCNHHQKFNQREAKTPEPGYENAKDQR